MLIPEKQTPTLVKDYRTMALLNCFFKIILKILTNRLSPIIGEMIGDYQMGFVIANVVIHQCNKTNLKWYLLKLDFEKAYDAVSWEFLFEILRLQGFGPRWISLIDIWLTIVKVEVLINGDKGKEIVCKRGLQQEDPLSLLLFVLVADSLNRMIVNVREAAMFRGLPGGSSSEFTNLQYADDMLNFGRCDMRHAIVLNCILSYFKK